MGDEEIELQLAAVSAAVEQIAAWLETHAYDCEFAYDDYRPGGCPLTSGKQLADAVREGRWRK